MLCNPRVCDVVRSGEAMFPILHVAEKGDLNSLFIILQDAIEKLYL